MGAYELADELEEMLKAVGLTDNRVPAMLRHQADYIAQLEKGLESSIAMNKAQAERRVKELTDEEISEVFKDCTKDGILDANDFARAILRKAQEK
jgi:SOS response regulatory protein OraA/RecX